MEDSDYYLFGGERVVVNNLDNHYKFTGQERDPESGLDYFGARYHASNLGRFLQVDPAMGSARLEVPQTWNRYSYVLNNPLRYIDLVGLEPVEAYMDAVFIIGSFVRTNFIEISGKSHPMIPIPGRGNVGGMGPPVLYYVNRGSEQGEIQVTFAREPITEVVEDNRRTVGSKPTKAFIRFAVTQQYPPGRNATVFGYSDPNGGDFTLFPSAFRKFSDEELDVLEEAAIDLDPSSFGLGAINSEHFVAELRHTIYLERKRREKQEGEKEEKEKEKEKPEEVEE